MTKKRVLVVDDDAAARLVLSEGLTFRGYNVDTAKGGLDALNKVPKTKPDIILLDMKMPDLSGYEVLQILKKDPNFQEVPVIAISATAGIGEEDKALHLGAADFMTKPLEPQNVAIHIEYVFEKRRPI
jgi:CheY-like chemotaxis protein